MSIVVGLLAVAVITLALVSGTSGGDRADASGAPRLAGSGRAPVGADGDGWRVDGGSITVVDVHDHDRADVAPEGRTIVG